MSYQALARKYRPNTLSEVVGQDRTVQALTNAFDTDRTHHAYLFSGTRGVGKTTLARIIAKCLNCETGITSTPCNKCDHCLAINDGSFVGLIEVDGASRNKVDDTRDLLDDIAYQAVVGRYKVYIIDEVHALSDASFQTLLKSLEEPPEHVKFVLATTNPESVPVTVRSRCIQFYLQNIDQEVINARLREILAHESIQFEDEAVKELARMGRGSMRDALSLTDQAISLCGDSLTTTEVLAMLGSAPQDDVSTLFDHLVAGNREKLFKTSRDIARRGVDYAELLAGMEVAIHQLAMRQVSKESGSQDSSAWEQSMTPERIQLIYQILIMGGRDLQYAPEPRVGFEMTLLRLLDYVPVKITTEIADEDSNQRTPKDEVKREPTLSSSPPPSSGTPSPANVKSGPSPSAKPNRLSSSQRKEKRQAEHKAIRAERDARKQRAMKRFESDKPQYVQTIKELFPEATLQITSGESE